jgi:hypothetical protein
MPLRGTNDQWNSWWRRWRPTSLSDWAKSPPEIWRGEHQGTFDCAPSAYLKFLKRCALAPSASFNKEEDICNKTATGSPVSTCTVT